MVFGSFRSWLRLLRQSDGIDLRYLPRILLVCLSTLATSPLRWLERQRYAPVLDAVQIDPAPIFIIGHWRTGTTHLHNLLIQDSALGYVSTFQAMAPGFCLVGDRCLRPLLSAVARHIHPTRLIDNIPLSFDAPQEDDFAIASLSPYSFLHLFTFPQQAASFFERYALFEGLPEHILAEWRQLYLGVLRKATFKAGGRRLVLKNPVNSGRIRTLLDMFPDARFIHICRDPYHVFQSMRFVYRAVLPRSQVQQVSPQRVDDYILEFYTRLMGKFLADKSYIPSGRLVEVRYEDLEVDPIGQLRHIYQELSLPGFSQAETAFRSYLDSVSGYQKNRYTIDAEMITLVNQHWTFALETWGYPRME